MKRGRSSSLLFHHYGGLGKKNGDGGESSKQAQRKSVASSSFCVFCDAKVINPVPTAAQGGTHEEDKTVDEEVEGGQRGEGVVVEVIGGIEVEIGGVLEERVAENRMGDQENNNNNNNNNNNGEVVEEEASEVFPECNLDAGFGDWNSEWAACGYPPFYGEPSEDGAYYYWDVLGNEAAASQWVENLWKD